MPITIVNPTHPIRDIHNTPNHGTKIENINDFSANTTQGASIEPTFLLRGLNIKSLVADYLNGEFDNIRPPKDKILRNTQQMTPDYAVGKDSDSKIYEFVDLTGKTQRIITTNHDKYITVKSKLEGKTCNYALDNGNTTLTELPKGGICLWCRRNFDHVPVGVPTKTEYLPDKNVTIFHVSEIFCTYECSYAFLKSRISCPFNYRDYRFVSSESMLLTMFEKTHPGKILKESPDWVLAQWNGGPLNEGDFFAESHSYLKSNNIVMLPVKLEYLVNPK